MVNVGVLFPICQSKSSPAMFFQLQNVPLSKLHARVPAMVKVLLVSRLFSAIHTVSFSRKKQLNLNLKRLEYGHATDLIAESWVKVGRYLCMNSMAFKYNEYSRQQKLPFKCNTWVFARFYMTFLFRRWLLQM